MSKTEKSEPKEKKVKKVLRSFYVPEYNTSVKAENAEEAISILSKKEK